MKYVKTINPITADGRKRSLSVGYAIKDLGLNVGDKLLAYLARPEDEFEIDTFLNGAGKQYYIVFSDRMDIITAHTLAQAEKIAAILRLNRHRRTRFPRIGDTLPQYPDCGERSERKASGAS